MNRNFEDELRKDLPRGVEGGEDSASDAQWMPKSELRGWSYRREKDGKAEGIFLGYRDGRDIGFTDDRHVLTVAGSRAGKGVSLIVPNLRLYDGSALCIDPKGELAKQTYGHREEKGQCCYALDPFGVAAKARQPRFACACPARGGTPSMKSIPKAIMRSMTPRALPKRW